MAELKQYSLPEYHRFIDDVQAAGFTPEHYNGRFDWHGPAVEAPDINDVLTITSVPCQWDNMGLDYIVYPKAKDYRIVDAPYQKPDIIEGDLRIWHIPQVPANDQKDIFIVRVRTLREAQLVYDALTAYDLFQLDTHIKPDYSSACGLEVFRIGKWQDWYSEEYDSFEEYLRACPERFRVTYNITYNHLTKE